MGKCTYYAQMATTFEYNFWTKVFEKLKLFIQYYKFKLPPGIKLLGDQ